jgi:hypothetical protein
LHRFHFNVEDGLSTLDTDGVELPSIHAARIEAIRLTGEILRDNPQEFWDRPAWQMFVTDEAGLTLFSVQVLATDAPALQIQMIPPNLA